jgi:hypothetical protein
VPPGKINPSLSSSSPRADLMEKRVVVSFAPPVQFNGAVMFQALRFKSVAATRNGPTDCKKEKKEGHRFWSAFAFES